MPNRNLTIEPHPDDDAHHFTPWQLCELWIQSQAAHDPRRMRELEIRFLAIRTQTLIDIELELHALGVGLAEGYLLAPKIVAEGLSKWIDGYPTEVVALRSMFRTSLSNLEAAIRDLVEATSHK